MAGAEVPLYALSNVARSAATRSDYIGATVYISIGGIEFGGAHGPHHAIAETLQINEQMDEGANTAQLRVTGSAVSVGAVVEIRRGSKANNRRYFGGRVLRIKQGILTTPAAPYQDLSLIDHTWGLNQYLISGRKFGTATAIADGLIAQYAPGYSNLAVVRDLGLVEGGITFTNQGLASVLTQLTRRVNASWFCDYARVIHMYPEIGGDPSIPPPTDLIASAPLLQLEGFTVDRDLSQFITRVYVEGGGTTAVEAIAPGSTILPVLDAAYYEAAGTVVSGPQRITYTSRELGDGGSLVGPGAAPTVALVASHADGGAIEAGTHDYAVAFVTASGVSVVGPRTSVVLGFVPAPVLAPTVRAFGAAATGPSPGVHVYACAYMTATGETPLGPVLTTATPYSDPPNKAPAAVIAAGTGLDDGDYDYACTYYNPGGETLPGPYSAIVTAATAPGVPLVDPSIAPMCAPVDGTGLELGRYEYAVTFGNVAGETLGGPTQMIETTVWDPPDRAEGLGLSSGTVLDVGAYEYAVTFGNAIGETTPGPRSAIETIAGVADPVHSPMTYGTYSPAGGATLNGIYRWRFTWRRQSDGAETLPAVLFTGDPAQAVTTGGPTIGWPVSGVKPSPPAGYDVQYYRTKGNTSGNAPFFRTTVAPIPPAETAVPGAIYDNMPDSGLGSVAPTFNNTARRRVAGSLSIGPSGTTRRVVYRTPVNGSQLKQVAVIPNNTLSAFTDNTPDASLGVNAPTANTMSRQRIGVFNIPVGPSGTTRRGIYRSAVGNVEPLRKVGEVAGNSASATYTDSTPDASRGAEIPATNTTAIPVRMGRAHLTGIPVPNLSVDGSITGKALFRRKAGGVLQWIADLANATTTYDDTLPHASAGRYAPVVNSACWRLIQLTLPPAPAIAVSVRLYGGPAESPTLYWITDAAPGAIYLVTITDADLVTGPRPPITPTATTNRINLSAIPIGPPGVTARYIYRTPAGSASLKILAALNDNVTTTFSDLYSDTLLGGDAPTADTSGLTQPQGVVLPGVTELIVATVRDFLPTGGWAIIGNGQQVIRYTGTSGGQRLTGIPATGVGAIVASISYGSTATPAPHLAGIPASGTGAIQYAIAKGDPVNLWVQIDDLAAQTAFAALLGGGDGIVEDFLQDRRLSAPEARARGTAHLVQRNQVTVTVRYRTRDTRTTVGARVAANLGPPTNLAGEFTIQSLSVGAFDPAGRNLPTYTVEASSVRYTFGDLLRLSQVPGIRW